MQIGGEENLYTASDALTDALVASGVTHIFLNSGTDYPPIIESWAKYEAAGLKKPEIIISPHEYAALSAAQGFAQLTGKAQAVFVHVDVGTQNLGGALHNAYRCRVPVYLFAGVSPYTIEGECQGGRNAAIQYLQNVGDQAGIVRGYTKMSGEMHSGKNVKQMVFRSLQVARSDPKGPVYTVASREVLEEESCQVDADVAEWSPVAPIGLDDTSVGILAQALMSAEKPLIVTSYLGRNADAVGELVWLCETLAIPVVESQQSFMNFPGTNELHLGFDCRGLLENADVVLVIDSDIPWIPAHVQPSQSCRVFYLDVDPLKEDIPMWYIPSERFMKADAGTALKQLNKHLASLSVEGGTVEARRKTIAERHRAMREGWELEAGDDTRMTPAFVAKTLHKIVNDDTVILNEAITSALAVDKLVPRTKPGTLFYSGGSSLGWHGGAAFGMKLAEPEKDIVAVTGDGSYIFSCPTAVFWMARKYNAPFMTVIFNNQGWNAPKMITTGEHPNGYAAQSGAFWTSFNPPAALDKVAEAAGGAFARTVSDPNELEAALLAGREAVKNDTCAVINVLIEPV